MGPSLMKSDTRSEDIAALGQPSGHGMVIGRNDPLQVSFYPLSFSANRGRDIALFRDKAVVNRGLLGHG